MARGTKVVRCRKGFKFKAAAASPPAPRQGRARGAGNLRRNAHFKAGQRQADSGDGSRGVLASTFAVL
eukprot:1083201-Pleurochrysis_carterae.AAC.2